MTTIFTTETISDELDSYDVETITAQERDPDFLSRPTEPVEAVEDDVDVVAPIEIVNEERELIREADAVLIPYESDTIGYQAGRLHEFAANQDFTPVIVYSAQSTIVPWAIADSDFVSSDFDSCVQFIQDLVAEMEGQRVVVETASESGSESNVAVDHPTTIPDGGDE